MDENTVEIDIECSDPIEKPENDPLIKKISSNWKLIAIISAFVNRCILEKVDLDKNFIIKDKKVITNTNAGDPTILNVTNVDVYSLNLFRQIHQSFDVDMRYMKSKHKQTVNLPESEVNLYTEDLSDDIKDLLDKLLVGLTTLNEQTVNFLSDGFENLYDQKVKKVVEYFIRQRDYYLSIGRIKIKYDRCPNLYDQKLHKVDEEQ